MATDPTLHSLTLLLLMSKQNLLLMVEEMHKTVHFQQAQSDLEVVILNDTYRHVIMMLPRA